MDGPWLYSKSVFVHKTFLFSLSVDWARSTSCMSDSFNLSVTVELTFVDYIVFNNFTNSSFFYFFISVFCVFHKLTMFCSILSSVFFDFEYFLHCFFFLVGLWQWDSCGQKEVNDDEFVAQWIVSNGRCRGRSFEERCWQWWRRWPSFWSFRYFPDQTRVYQGSQKMESMLLTLKQIKD